MATPTKDASNAAAIAAQAAIFAAGNQKFIDDADARIADVIAQGHFRQSFYTNTNVDMEDIINHYQDLGYDLNLPDCPTMWDQPAQLFGQDWIDFWEGRRVCTCKNPCMITIAWK